MKDEPLLSPKHNFTGAMTQRQQIDRDWDDVVPSSGKRNSSFGRIPKTGGQQFEVKSKFNLINSGI